MASNVSPPPPHTPTRARARLDLAPAPRRPHAPRPPQVGSKGQRADEGQARRSVEQLARRMGKSPAELLRKFDDVRHTDGVTNLVCILEKLTADESFMRLVSGAGPRPGAGGGAPRAPSQEPGAVPSMDVSTISGVDPGSPSRSHLRGAAPRDAAAAGPASASGLGSSGLGLAGRESAGAPAPGNLLGAVGDLLEPCQASQSAAVGDFSLPGWLTQRDFLTGDHVLDDLYGGPGEEAGAAPLESFPPEVQEQLVVDDLLFAMLGLSGRYVRLEARAGPGGGPGAALALAPGVEPTVAELSRKLLPLCESALVLQRFVQKRLHSSRGLVAQALAAAVQGYLSDWGVMVAQLEHLWRQGRLTLQAMLYYCQPAAALLGLLASVAGEASAGGLRGGALLCLLERREREAAGNPQARGVLRELLSAASEPYMRAVQRWIVEGVLDDPFGELFVSESAALGADHRDLSSWWNSRFSLSADQEVPAFLAPYREQVLTAGKYLNAIRDCKAPVEPPLPPGTRLAYSPDPRPLRDALAEAHRSVSKQLLRVVVEDGRLLERLESMRRFFLTSQGDFLVHFLDLADAELQKPYVLCNKERVQSLLEVAARTTGAAQDPFHEDIEAAFDKTSLGKAVFQVYLGHAAEAAANVKKKKAIDCLTLRCRVSGPSALVVTHKAMQKYQLLFRHVNFVKDLERRLCKASVGLTACRSNRGLQWAQREAQLLLQQMIHFLQHYQVRAPPATPPPRPLPDPHARCETPRPLPDPQPARPPPGPPAPRRVTCSSRSWSPGTRRWWPRSGARRTWTRSSTPTCASWTRPTTPSFYTSRAWGPRASTRCSTSSTRRSTRATSSPSTSRRRSSRSRPRS